MEYLKEEKVIIALLYTNYFDFYGDPFAGPETILPSLK